MIKSILVTAFEPFGGDALNPTELILSALPDTVDGARLLKQLLPVEFSAAGDIAVERILREKLAAVILMGQAGGRDSVTPERVAINIMDAYSPDNAGFMPQDAPAVPSGPSAYFSTLPIKRIVEAINAVGVPAKVSNSAGTYVCNCLMYRVLHALAENGVDIPAGFIHFPFIEEQVKLVPGREQAPFITLDSAVRAAAAAIEAVNAQ